MLYSALKFVRNLLSLHNSSLIIIIEGSVRGAFGAKAFRDRAQALIVVKPVTTQQFSRVQNC